MSEDSRRGGSQSDADRKDRQARRRRRRRKGRPDVERMTHVDFKDVRLLKQFVNDRGSIVPRRQTGLSARAQRELTLAIKRAREMALLPFVIDS